MTVVHDIPVNLCPQEWYEFLEDLDTDRSDDASIKELIIHIVTDMKSVEETKEMFDRLDLLFSRVSKYNRG